ncbi:hypothetical protein, partial [Mammaliicoccus sciuri]|uniref:hypothetical protein n=1 Tax=Mammaliicoccus sciuri TaxID=1296 RepID=UPI00289F947E
IPSPKRKISTPIRNDQIGKTLIKALPNNDNRKPAITKIVRNPNVIDNPNHSPFEIVLIKERLVSTSPSPIK